MLHLARCRQQPVACVRYSSDRLPTDVVFLWSLDNVGDDGRLPNVLKS